MDTRSIRAALNEVPAEKPKTAVCAGCLGEYPRCEMVQLHEDNHDNLTYFHGDRLCRPCARSNGVAF